jgi:DNA-binding transcriptional LysR family regulator
VPLFHRHARGLILTEQGELLNKTARDVFAKLSMTEAMLTESREHAKGPLKITTTVAFGTTWLTPRAREFLQKFPDIQLSLLLDDTELDLGMREADIAIRMTQPRQPDLIQRHLMTIRFHVYGHVSYLKRKGVPKTVQELDNHDLIAYPTDMRAPISNINWLLDAGDPPQGTRNPIMRVNNVYAIFKAVESGLGMAALPDYMVEGSRDIVRVLPELNGPKVETYFVYAEELRHSKRIDAFRDFLVRKVAETAF